MAIFHVKALSKHNMNYKIYYKYFNYSNIAKTTKVSILNECVLSIHNILNAILL
jgi:hypothetical protein